MAAMAASGCRSLVVTDREVLGRIRARVAKELFENVLPFWVRHSVDREFGGFVTCLNRDGSAYDTFKQMWMQWREVWMFARLFRYPQGGQACLDLAREGHDFLHAHGRKPAGDYWYMLDRKGNPICDSDNGCEIFTESFVAIGCAELYRATHDARYRAEAESAYRIYRRKTDGAEAPSKELPAKRTYVQLAYPMIMLNVLQVMNEAFGGGYEREIADCIARIRRFTHPTYGLLFERAPAEGGFDLESQYGRYVNPGHALEGCVFVQRELRERPNAELLSYVREETLRMLEWGWDEERGGIRYGTDVFGLPQLRTDAGLKAWWPQAEAMTAALGAYELTRDTRFLDYYRKVDDFCTRHLRDPDHPEWFAYAATDGWQVHEYKGSRYKGFFHIPRYLCECMDACDRMI